MQSTMRVRTALLLALVALAFYGAIILSAALRTQ